MHGSRPSVMGERALYLLRVTGRLRSVCFSPNLKRLAVKDFSAAKIKLCRSACGCEGNDLTGTDGEFSHIKYPLKSYKINDLVIEN